MISPQYNKKLSHTYILSIQIRLDGLSFDVFDPVKNIFLIAHNYTHTQDHYYGKQEEILLRNPLFHLPYRQTVVALTDLNFTTIPTTLFDPQQSKQLLQFAGYNVEKDSYFLSDNLPMAGATLVYYIPTFLYFFLKSELNHLTLLHQATAIANVLLLKRLEQFNNNVKVHFTNEKMIVVATKNNILKLCNSFTYTNYYNATYTLLNILQQLDLQTEYTKIDLSGNIHEQDIRFIQIQKFAPNVALAQLPPWFDYGGKIDNVWQFADLFDLMLCV